MLKQWIYGATMSLALVVLAGCASSTSPELTNVLNVKAVAIQSRTTGSSAALNQPSVYLINDGPTLDALGSDALAAIPVDFETQSLIVLAMGQCPSGGYWAHIEGVQQLGTDVVVQGVANVPTQGSQTQSLTFPFEAVVVDKVNGKLVSDVTSVQDNEHPSDEIMVEPAAVQEQEPAVDTGNQM